jgi:MscS family membrane protein
MIDWLRWLVPKFKLPTWEDGALVVIILLAGYFVQKYIVGKLVQVIGQLFVSSKKPFIGRVIKEFEKAIRYAFFTAVVFLAGSFLLEVSLFENEHTANIFVTLSVLYIFKGIYDVLSYFGKHPNSFRLAKKNDDIIKPYIIRLLKVVTVALSIFIIASFWNFNLNGFLTGIGLTGVAVAFSVRETLTHVVSGMSIALDKPFQIGDWITTEDQKIDGIVEDINLRSTLIQTIDKGLIYVPNSYLVNKPIYNLAERNKRKCELYMYFAMENEEEQLRMLCHTLHEQIALHPKTSKELISVTFDELYANSLRLYVRFYVKTNDQNELLEVRQDVLFAIHDMIKQNGLIVAPLKEELALTKNKD